MNAMAQMQPNPAMMQPAQIQPAAQAPVAPQPQPQPQSQPSPFLQGQMLEPPNALDRFNQGLQSIGNGGSIIGALTGRRTDPQSMALAVQNQTLSAKYQGLIAAGYTPKEAMVGAVDPEAFKAMAPQAFGGEPGKTLEIQGEDGIKRQAEFKDGKWSIIKPGGTPAPASQGQFGTAAPMPPAPPGVNVADYNSEIAKNSASEAKDVQTKAEGGVAALQVLQRLKDRVASANSGAFGPIAGTETAQTARSIAGNVPLIGGNAHEIAQHQAELRGLYTDAGTGMLKARFGSRVTNMDVTQGMKIVGGLESPNKETALKTLDNNIAEAYDSVAQGIKRGVVNPQEVLQKPTSAAQAKALGPGALYIAPDGSVRRNPR